MAAEETARLHGNPETESPKKAKKPDRNSMIDQSSPRGVLETTDTLSSSSSVSETNTTNNSRGPTSSEKPSAAPPPPSSGAHSPRDFIRDFGGNMNLPWKSFVGGIKKSYVRRFSTSTIAMLTGYDLSKKTWRKKLARIRSAEDGIDCGLLPIATKPTWRNFQYAELAAATDDFSPERMLGKGGHAEVYRGHLPDGTLVAVKRLIKENKDEDERIADFLSELGIIAHIDHPNTAKLIGFSAERGLFLILQFAPHGSLASHIHGSAVCELTWDVRFKVAVGIAEGLRYMHDDCQRRIIHRDIKASNILLAEGFKPLISDFGLAKWLPDKWLHHVVHPIEGTFGYLAPEYFMHGIVDEKIDVFAFGVLLLELITGRRAVDSSRQSLAMWAKPFLESNNAKELADPQLGGDYDPLQMKRAVITASMCIRHEPSRRPHMNKVVELLRGEGCGLPEVKQKSIAPRSLLLDACDLEDYTCSNYLKDLSRHRELIMEY